MPFSFWSDVAFMVALGLIVVVAIACAAFDLSPWLMALAPVVQNLFLAGVYVGRWHTRTSGREFY